MYSIELDASSNNIPVTFTSAAGSLVGSDIPAGSRALVINETGSTIAFSIADYDSAPSATLATNRNQGFCLALGTTAINGITISNKSKIYVRSLSGSIITTGKVYVSVWGHK